MFIIQDRYGYIVRTADTEEAALAAAREAANLSEEASNAYALPYSEVEPEYDVVAHNRYIASRQ